MDDSKAHFPLNRPARHRRSRGVVAAAFVAGVFGLTTPALADGPPVSLEAAKQWQFIPPAPKGEPVEVVDTTWVTFQISEYVMQ